MRRLLRYFAKIFGRGLIVIGNLLPVSSYAFHIGKIVRGMGAKLFLDKCGKNVNVEKNASFSSRCTIGNNSGIGINARIGVCHIGDDVMMAPDVVILSQNHVFERIDIPMNMQGVTEEKPVYIGNDVWIGQRVIILPGVHVGNGVVIGAGSIVTHDISDYDVVAGSPARVIKNRKANG